MSEPTIQITEKQLAEQIEKGFMAGAKHAMENLAPQAMLALEEKLAARSTPKQGEADAWRLIEDEPKEGGLYLVVIADQRHIAHFNPNTTTRWWRPYGMPAPLAARPSHWKPLSRSPLHE